MSKLQTFRHSLLIISITIVLILGSQVYRTFSNYQLNKQRFINDVQLALDLSVEKYYAEKAQKEFKFMSLRPNDSLHLFTFDALSLITDSVGFDSLDIESEVLVTTDTLLRPGFGNSFHYSYSSGNNTLDIKSGLQKYLKDSSSGSVFTKFNVIKDSSEQFKFERFSQLAQKIIISTDEEELDLEQLKSLFGAELARKQLTIDHQLVYKAGAGRQMGLKREEMPHYPLSTTAKSTYLFSDETLQAYFENASLLILKRGIWDLLLSLAIVLSVIGALRYLYRVIRTQKELAMIKDDLIGNVTHEFKTPIATVISALEGIANFNESNDQEKTKRYLEMSQDQLAKLNVMVEKLMETATIDSGEIEINKAETDLIEMTNHVVQNFRVRMGAKQLKAELSEGSLWAMVDPFHWENVMSNLLDNAIKYGGDQITVRLEKAGAKIRFQVIDNGGNIERVHKDRVFDKLYRIPKGNQHDVKGFGIGLYYTKSIVEQHGGQISLEVSANRTCFTVSL